MAVQTSSPISTTAPAAPTAEKKTWLVTATSLVFIILQSACTAVIALSGVRVAIGLSALAVATFGVHGPAVGFHRDAIRIPMMIAARPAIFSVAHPTTHTEATALRVNSDCACSRHSHPCSRRVDRTF
jgi:hypothetical protein